MIIQSGGKNMVPGICAVPGISVGHAQNVTARTGCTVILPAQACTAGVDVGGSATGTHEIELLKPVRLVQQIHAILLTGGSSFGLAAVVGVKNFLEEKNIGYDTGVARVPIVPAAVIFDLAVGDAKVRPDADMGYQACLSARTTESAEGLIGAGTGATVGKIAGQTFAMNGGIGTCAWQSGEIVVGALSVVNSLGNIIDGKTGATVAGARRPQGDGFFDPVALLGQTGAQAFSRASPINTTLAVVATNVALSREQATKVAQMAQDGLARAIYPAHTLYDGDIVFVLSTGAASLELNALGTIAADLVADSIVRAVRVSNSLEA